jgi:hypothetical protein
VLSEVISMVRALAVLLVVAAPTALLAAPAADSTRLTGGAVLEILRYHNPGLGGEARARVRDIRSVVVAPAPLVADTDVLTEFVRLVHEKTGWRVSTPREFGRVAMEMGETPFLETGLTEDEQNALGRKVAQKLGVDAALLIRHSPGEWKYTQPLLIGLLYRFEQTGALAMRLVTTDHVPWAQRMDYRITVQSVRANPPFPPMQEVAGTLLRRMVERFVADAGPP